MRVMCGSGTDYKQQIITQYDTGDTWMRTFGLNGTDIVMDWKRVGGNLNNLKPTFITSEMTRATLMQNAEEGIQPIRMYTGSPVSELPANTEEWIYSSGLLIKRTSAIATIALYGYGTGNTAVTTTSDSGKTWTTYKIMQDELDSLSKNYVMLGSDTGIPANADLNSYNTIGNYYCNSNTIASTLVNCPTSKAFKMIVDYATGYGYPRQIIIPYQNNGIYLRTLQDSGNVFGSWEKLATYSDVCSSFTVENPTGAYSEASLKSQIHQRMITLVNKVREQVGYNKNLHVPWDCTWAGYSCISGEVTFFPSDTGNNHYTYMTTLFLYNQAFLCYGITSNSEMSYFNKLL